MLAVDTNVLVRYLVEDDSAQTARAAKLIQSRPVWVSKTVLLETAWVLGSSYEFPAESVVRGLRGLLSLPTVSVEDESSVAQALDWAEQGLDVADALHLASAGSSMPFATFDQSLVRRAKRFTTSEIVVP